MNINPSASFINSHCQGRLVNVTVEEINVKLGFTPNQKDDPYKVKYSWGFFIDGKPSSIWDWKGSHANKSFSWFGERSDMEKIFGKSRVI